MCSFTNELGDNIQQWANTIISIKESALRAHCQTAVLLFPQVTTQHGTISTLFATTLVKYNEDLQNHAATFTLTQDAITSLQVDVDPIEELLAENRTTIKALSCLAHSAQASCPIPIIDPVMYIDIKENLETFLNLQTNKLRGDPDLFTSPPPPDFLSGVPSRRGRIGTGSRDLSHLHQHHRIH